MASEGSYEVSILAVPKFDGFIERSACEILSAGAKFDLINELLMPGHPFQRLFRDVWLPEKKSKVIRTGDKSFMSIPKRHLESLLSISLHVFLALELLMLMIKAGGS